MDGKGRALVVGGSGFIGSHVVRAFTERAWEVTIVDQVAPSQPVPSGVVYVKLPLPNPDFERVLSEADPATVILAAGLPLVRESFSDPGSDFRSCSVLTFDLLDQVRKVSPKARVLMVSSAAVYGDPSSLPISEEAPRVPLSPYGYHRLLSEVIAEEFRAIFNIDVVVFRVFSTFGPGLKRQLIWDLVRKAMLGSGDTATLLGTGEDSRDFLPVEDIAATLARAAEISGPLPIVLNLGSGTDVTVREIAVTVLKMMGVSKQLVFSGQEDHGLPKHWRADTRRLRRTGLFIASDFNQRLENTVRWMMNELDPRV